MLMITISIACHERDQIYPAKSVQRTSCLVESCSPLHSNKLLELLPILLSTLKFIIHYANNKYVVNNTQLCLICNHMACSQTGSSLSMGFFRARILEWFAISPPWNLSPPRDLTHVPCIADTDCCSPPVVISDPQPHEMKSCIP